MLADAGASLDGRSVCQGRFGTHTDSAIFNGNFAAAEHLLRRGAPLTLSSALCLGRWADVERLLGTATLGERQDAFVLAALNGKAEALRRMLAHGVNPTTVSAQNYAHATALHHAVCSGSLETVKVLVEAGADLTRRDTDNDGTPLGWAEYHVWALLWPRGGLQQRICDQRRREPHSERVIEDRHQLLFQLRLLLS